jgi:transcriptional regulator with XRE-family HTH domain
MVAAVAATFRRVGIGCKVAPGRRPRPAALRGYLEDGLTHDIAFNIIDAVNDITPAALLKTARERAHLSQRELAARARTTQATIARIESSAANPSVRTFQRLLKAAGYALRVEPLAVDGSDASIEAYKRDVDRTLLVEQLRKSPAQRARDLVALATLADEARRGMLAAKRKR